MLRGLNALLLVGSHDHAIDAKQRLAIPSKFREELKAASAEELFAVVRDGVLCLFTREGYERWAAALEQAPRSAEEVLPYQDLFYSDTEKLTFDKQGRVRIPENMLQEAELTKDVTVMGARDHLQVRDRERWKQQKQQMRRKRPDLLTDPRKMGWHKPG